MIDRTNWWNKLNWSDESAHLKLYTSVFFFLFITKKKTHRHAHQATDSESDLYHNMCSLILNIVLRMWVCPVRCVRTQIKHIQKKIYAKKKNINFFLCLVRGFDNSNLFKNISRIAYICMAWSYLEYLIYLLCLSCRLPLTSFFSPLSQCLSFDLFSFNAIIIRTSNRRMNYRSAATKRIDNLVFYV